jgi:hypothetical protein
MRQVLQSVAGGPAFRGRRAFERIRLPVTVPDLPPAAPGPNDVGPAKAGAFYENKRLLDAFAARKYPVRKRRDGRVIEYIRTIS